MPRQIPAPCRVLAKSEGGQCRRLLEAPFAGGSSPNNPSRVSLLTGSISRVAKLIDREHALPITRQTKASNISSGSMCHLPPPVAHADLAIMQHVERKRCSAATYRMTV
ncbi:hypothetical protein ABIB00_007401 [Bradyrhizobium sp. LB14.3]|uniref:hypothetical protein n=1 Tax=Bradyrhizobium sp. LB14.3 TaxID=3156328 RepID=UPI0033949080